MANFDSIWQQKYSAGETVRYPWDSVVSFVFRHAPRDRARSDVKILEIGCGTASNLWFAAREGFSVSGIDGSVSAIDAARARFEAEGLAGHFVVGDFAQPLPFSSDEFDLVIDRGAIVCTGFSAGMATVKEIHRVLKPQGLFHFNPYSRRHSSFMHATTRDDDLVSEVTAGTLTGVGQLCFYDEDMVRQALAHGWHIESMNHVESFDFADGKAPIHAEWKIVARKVENVETTDTGKTDGLFGADDKANEKFYTQLLNTHGSGHKAVNWGSAQSQEARFQVLAEIGIDQASSVLDVGCGTGDFLAFLRKRGYRGKYRGVDLVPAMIEQAKAQHPEASFEVKNLLNEEEIRLQDWRADFVVASGLFYLRRDLPLLYFQTLVRTLFSISRRGLAVNSLSSWADRPSEQGEFRIDPLEAARFCHTLTPFVVLRHDYHPADFTMYVLRHPIAV